MPYRTIKSPAVSGSLSAEEIRSAFQSIASSADLETSLTRAVTSRRKSTQRRAAKRTGLKRRARKSVKRTR